jgi:hypothetical protein
MDMTGYYYRASRGETFDSAALAIYDNEKYAAELLCANPEHSGKMVFDGGELLRIPDIDIPETDGTESALPVKAPWRE